MASKKQQDPHRLVERRQSPGKGIEGLGLFAKEKIPRGTHLLPPRPLPTKDTLSKPKDILGAYGPLKPAPKVYYASPDQHPKALQNPACNWRAIPALYLHILNPVSADQWNWGAWNLIPRMHHACLPNIVVRPHKNTMSRSALHAIRDLYKHYGELMVCPECQKTEEARKIADLYAKMYVLDRDIAKAKEDGAWVEMRRGAQRMTALLQGDGVSCAMGELGQTFFEVAYASVKMGDAKVALIWARKTLDADLYSMKADWPECSELSDVIKKLDRTVEGNAAIDEDVVEWFEKPRTQPYCVELRLRAVEKLGLKKMYEREAKWRSCAAGNSD